jgi:hypothetical protein
MKTKIQPKSSLGTLFNLLSLKNHIYSVESHHEQRPVKQLVAQTLLLLQLHLR